MFWVFMFGVIITAGTAAAATCIYNNSHMVADRAQVTAHFVVNLMHDIMFIFFVR